MHQCIWVSHKAKRGPEWHVRSPREENIGSRESSGVSSGNLVCCGQKHVM